MRLSRDTTNYRARGVIVRDARHVHNGPEVPKHRGGKDTKRWCGGKVGREHKPQCMAQRIGTHSLQIRYYVLACTVCGKEQVRYWPMLSEKKPDWVVEEP